jgi:RNA polymerase sigma-70 factor (ECF subfamily)
VDLERVGEAAPAADERALATAGMEELAVLLDRLSADQREVLTLRVIADLSIEQVASVMGKRAGAIKALQHRAIESLRRLLASESRGIRHSTDIGRGITR